MWKVLQSLGLCAVLTSLVTSRDAYGNDHPPLFPDFCELDADYDWFEPIYCDCPDEQAPNEGLFFTYERVNWNVLSAPRYPVGQGGLQVLSSVLIDNSPLLVNPPATTRAPGATAVGNAVDVSRPDSEFGWGNRFEVGYSLDQAGWTVGVISNLNVVDRNVHGVANNAANTQPFTGSVAVMFEASDDLFRGFVDADGDGAIDDVDGDGGAGPGVNPNDFGDLVIFVPSFDTLTINHKTQVDGVELMRTLRRDNFFSRQATVEFLYGLRFLRVDAEMQALGVGGLLANSNWFSKVENKMVGPQVGLRWTRAKGRFALRSEGRFMAAMNVRDAALDGTMGSLFQPSRVNNPLYFNPTSFSQHDSDLQFSPVAEARLEAVFSLTKKIALKAGYTGTYASNLGYGSNMVRYTLPELTLRSLDDIPTQHFFSNGVNVGFEINR